MADLKKLLKYKEDDKLAIYNEMVELNSNLEALQGLRGMDLSQLTHLKGDQGEPGKTPVRGIDFMHEQDIQDFFNSIMEKVNLRLDEFQKHLEEVTKKSLPKKGIDYKDGKDGAKFRGKVKSVKELPEDAADGDQIIDESTGDLYQAKE